VKRIIYLVLPAFVFITACKKGEPPATPATDQSKTITLSIDKTINDSTLVLKWSKYNRTNFTGYQLRRTSYGFTNGFYQSTSITLKSFTNADSLTYTERNMPYSDKILYSVSAFADSSAYSNIITYNRPNTVFLQALFSDALIDRQNKILYLIYQNNGTITAINYATNTLIKTGSVGVGVNFSGIGTFQGSTELYVPGNDGQLYIIDAATLATKEKFATSGHINSVYQMDGKLFVAWTAASYGDNTTSIRVYDRVTKQLISSTGYYNNTRLVWLPGTNYEFIEETANESPTQFQYYKFDSSGLSLSESTITNYAVNPYDVSILKAFPDGSRFIASSMGYVFTKNLVQETYIPNYISTDPNAKFSDFEINSAGSVIYCAEASDRLINVMSYPSPKLLKTYNTVLYPSKLFIDGNQLICVSKQAGGASGYYIDIEKFGL